jgi:hypothetical protein
MSDNMFMNANHSIDDKKTTPDRESTHVAITWQASLPLLTNAVVIRQLFFVLAFSALCVLAFLLSLEAFEGHLNTETAWSYLRIVLLILGGLSFLAALVMLVVYGNQYDYHFSVDEVGAKAETAGGTRKKNSIINFLLLLSGRPGPAGAGLLAASRQSEMVKWKDVDQVDFDARKMEIVLRRKKRALMLVQCNAENFDQVLSVAQQAVGDNQH